MAQMSCRRNLTELTRTQPSQRRYRHEVAPLRVLRRSQTTQHCLLLQPQSLTNLAHRGKPLGDGLFVTRRPTDFSKRDAPLVQTERPEPPRWGRHTPPASEASYRSATRAERVDTSPRRCNRHRRLCWSSCGTLWGAQAHQPDARRGNAASKRGDGDDIGRRRRVRPR